MVEALLQTAQVASFGTEVGKSPRKLREQITKLGMLTDGNYGHPDQAEMANTGRTNTGSNCMAKGQWSPVHRL